MDLPLLKRNSNTGQYNSMNLVETLSDSPESVFSLRKQFYIPLFSFSEGANKVLYTEDKRFINDIIFTRPNIDDTSIEPPTISNYTHNLIIKFLRCNHPVDKLYSTSFVRDGVSHNIYISNGCIFDENFKLLVIIAVHKNIIQDTNFQENPANYFQEVTKMLNCSFSSDEGEINKFKGFLNKYGVLIINKEFTTKSIYKNIYKRIFNNFVENLEGLDLDYIITNNVEKNVFRLTPPKIKTYASIREKVESQKEAWKSML